MVNPEQIQIKKLQEQIDLLKKELVEKDTALQEAREKVNQGYHQLQEKEEELQRLDKMKSEFISIVSHELRTPMTVVKESITQVLDGLFGEIPENQNKILMMALKNIDRLARIVNDLIDISKLEAGRVDVHEEKLDVVFLIKDLVALFDKRAKEKGLCVLASFSDETIPFMTDRDKLVQVFKHLVRNAIQFTEKGQIEVCVQKKEDVLECCVKDSGVGISKENLPKMFEKFQQFGRKHGPGDKGTGLGLAICKNIVELLQGDIRVESVLDVGSCFTITLPLKNY